MLKNNEDSRGFKMKKQLPIGCSDFKKLIDKNYYYIDKTLFSDYILRCDGEIILLPRPRRFGKTLNISMLKYFFESSYAHPSPRLWVTGKATEDKKTQQSHAYLFEDKKIWQLPERRALQGKFPVIFLTFKDIKQSTWEMTREKLIAAIAEEYERHRYLLDSGEVSLEQKEVYLKILAKKANDGEYHNSLKNLTEFLHRYHQIKPFV